MWIWNQKNKADYGSIWVHNILIVCESTKKVENISVFAKKNVYLRQ